MNEQLSGAATGAQDEEERGIYALAASPDHPGDGVLFAASAAGLLRSVDRATSFRDAYASLELETRLPTAAVALSPAFKTDRTVLAGVHGAILRSLDGGASWQYSLLRTPPPVVTCLAISPAYEEDGIAFAGTLEDGVFRSADRGARWAAWNFGLIDLGVLCLAVSPAFGEDETLFAGTETGVFRSANGGRAWREAGLPIDLAPVLSLAISPYYTNDHALFAGTEENGLWRSGDGGLTWSAVEALGAVAVNALLVSPGEDTFAIAALTDEGLRVSRDGGLTWKEVPVALPEDVGAMCLAAPGGVKPGAPLLVGCSDGSIRTVFA